MEQTTTLELGLTSNFHLKDAIEFIGEGIEGIVDPSLADINVHPNNPVFSSENGVLFNKNKTVYPDSSAYGSENGRLYKRR